MTAGVLLLHGIFGSPREFEPLVPVLTQAGYQPRCVTLPGHGLRPDQSIESVRVEDILAHCLSEYEALAAHCDEVMLVGHSLGGLSALLIAAHRPAKLSRMVALSAPYDEAYLLDRLLYLSSPVETLLRGLPYVPDSMTGLERPAFRPWHYPLLLREGRRTLEALQRQLPRVNVPVLLAHSPYDLTVPYRNRRKIARILSEEARVPVFEHDLSDCGHQVFPKSRAVEASSRLILSFLRASLTEGDADFIDNGTEIPSLVGCG
jgi:carboxylesterase